MPLREQTFLQLNGVVPLCFESVLNIEFSYRPSLPGRFGSYNDVSTGLGEKGRRFDCAIAKRKTGLPASWFPYRGRFNLPV